MTTDANKAISVAYNFLNLPTKVDFGSGDSIVWVYTVSGAKLRKTVYDNGSVQTTIDYVNGYQYKNGSLDFFAMEAGRVKKTSSGALRYEYNLTDHLGNTRVSFADTLGNDTAVILQEDHYYAFGLRIEGLSSTTKDNKFTYNGKELEDEHGLGWYHYGARYYDPQVGRWWTVDPVDELLSPYSSFGNSPVVFHDPDGKDIIIYFRAPNAGIGSHGVTSTDNNGNVDFGHVFIQVVDKFGNVLEHFDYWRDFKDGEYVTRFSGDQVYPERLEPISPQRISAHQSLLISTSDNISKQTADYIHNLKMSLPN